MRTNQDSEPEREQENGALELPVDWAILTKRMDRLLIQLEKAYPDKASHWYDKVYEKVVFFTKYVGLPSLILAAIVPMYDLGKSFVEHRNTEFLVSIYTQYISELLEKGEIDRANVLLGDLSAGANKGLESRYLQAKILAKMALSQGRKQAEAEDRINLLLRLHRNNPFLFPALGGERETFDLELALVDIDINLQRYDSARHQLDVFRARTVLSRDSLVQAKLQLRQGQIKVLTFDTAGAVHDLIEILPVLNKASDKESLGAAFFQLAKAYQFQSKNQLAADTYQRAREIYEKESDKTNLLRVYNNMGLLFQAQTDNAKARYFYELEEKLAREVGDDTGLARSLVNLSLVARHEGKFPEAIRLAQEALAIFEKQLNKLGVASAYQNLGVIYARSGNKAAAIHNANQALLIFQDLNDLRGIGSVLGLLGELYRANDDKEAAGFFLAFIAIQTYLKADANLTIQQDLNIYKNSVLAVRRELGEDQYFQQLPGWLRLVDKLLVPHGIIEPAKLIPTQFISRER